MADSDTAYLLGMIVGKGSLIRENEFTKVVIEIPHKNFEIEGMEAKLSVEASVNRIKERIEKLLEARITTNSQKSKTTISFNKDNQSLVMRELRRYLGDEYTCKDFRVPKEIFGLTTNLKLEFLRGFSDVTAHVRSTNYFFNSFGHRIYIEIPQNWFLVVDICNLLKDVNVPVQTIDWGHPNIRDSNSKEYNEGRTRAWFREHQIKIFADEFEVVGFYVEHKKRALKKLADLNRTEWDKYCKQKAKDSKDKLKEKWLSRVGKLKETHHKYYWDGRGLKKVKPKHPEESSELIPKEIRGKHFNSWIQIAKELGYKK